MSGLALAGALVLTRKLDIEGVYCTPSRRVKMVKSAC